MPPRGGTAWTSERIRPTPHKPSAQQTPSKSDKGKGRAGGTPEPPRSAAVRKLDRLLAGLHSPSPPTRSPAQDGCFHYPPARAHALSEYTPLCTACGLVLCAQHAPHRPCPHCAAPLLDPAARRALMSLLDERRAHVLKEEGAARARAADELRLAAGAFPTLGGGAAAAQQGSLKGAARVLSVDSRTKRVRVVESFRATEEEGGADGDGEVLDGAGAGVPPPPREVQYLRVPRGPATRWAVSKDGEGGAKYVAPRGHARGKGKAPRDVAGA